MRLSVSLGIVAILVALVLAAGCATPSAAPAVTVENPFARPSPSEGGNGGAFMTIVNAGATADRLVSAQSSASKTVELHETTDEGGVMKMRPVPGGFEVPANDRLELKPGGKHVMLIGLTAPLVAGQTVEITLNFEKSGLIKLAAPVRQ